LLRIQIGHIAGEHQVHVRTARIGAGVVAADRGHARSAADLNVLVPLLLLDRAAVDLEVNTIVLYQYFADAGLIAGLRRGTPHGKFVLQLFPTGRQISVLQGQASLSRGSSRPNTVPSGIACADPVPPGLL